MSEKSFTEKDVERIANAMHYNRMKVARAARDLGVSRDTLYVYLRQFDAQLQQHYEKLRRYSVPELPRKAQIDARKAQAPIYATPPLAPKAEPNILRLNIRDYTGAFQGDVRPMQSSFSPDALIARYRKLRS